MLTRLKLGNFKSWATTGDLVLKPITGFFGANSSGKTSILQALLLLKQTADSADRGLVLQFGEKNSLVNLGDFRSVIHRHADENELRLALDWRVAKPLTVKNVKGSNEPVVQDDQLGFTTVVRDENGSAGKSIRLTVPELRYRVGKVTFGMRKRADRNEYKLFSEGADADFQFVRTPGRAWPLPSPAKCYGFPDQVRAYYQNAGFLSDLELALEERLRSIYYLGPLRAYPERTYTWAGTQPSDMGQAGEQAVHAILSSRDRGEKISRGRGRGRGPVSLEQYVAEWLKKLGLIAEFKVEAVKEGSQIFQVKVKKTTGSSEALLTDVGFGVSQILPVIVLCFYVPEGSTVILEQPEIHLHPAVQARLADVLIDAYRKRHVQIIVESHSEHLLRRLQRRIAENELSNADAAFYFCEWTDQASIATPLNVDLYGSIANWPRDFFGDEFGEIEAMQTAMIQRKKEEKIGH
jgi:predicted ATPase